MARPPYPGKIHHFRLTLCLREGEHDDLIAALQGVGNRQRAQAVIAMMRQGVRETAVTPQISDAEAAAALTGLMF